MFSPLLAERRASSAGTAQPAQRHKACVWVMPAPLAAEVLSLDDDLVLYSLVPVPENPLKYPVSQLK